MIISLYNANKKELIGIFKGNLAGKYLFPFGTASQQNSRVFAAAKGRYRVYNTIFSFPVAARPANPDQIKAIGDNLTLISNGYPPMSEERQRGFNESPQSFAMKPPGGQDYHKWEFDVNKCDHLK